MRGFIQGSLWGLVLGGAGLSVASLVNEPPSFAAGPDAPQLTAPQMEPVAESPSVALRPGSEDAPTIASVASLDQVADAGEAAPDVSSESATLPQTSDVTAAIESPEATLDTDVVADVAAPAAPRVETALIEPEPKTDAANVETTPAAALPIADDVEETAEVAPEPENTDEEVAPALAEASDPEIDAVEASESPAPAEEAAPAVAEAIVAPTQELQVDESPSVTEAEEAVAPEVEVVETLPQSTTTVRINRPGATESAPEEEVIEASDEDVIPDDAPALLRNAAPFEANDAPANIAILLIDEGAMENPVDAVAGLGFTPTVTVDALSSASTDLAQSYRTAGIEVAMQSSLPEGAQPVDVEVAFEAALGLLPDVAMLFSDGTGAMQDRAVTAQVMEILAADGYGFVAVQRGLSNAARDAEQAGVSATTILRDIDGDGEDIRAITRALDQAAFRARQTGEAVLLGRVQPDTLAALRDWAAELDQDALAIAPVSAILLSDTAN